MLVTRDGPALRNDLPENGRARLEESLEAGQLVIAPERPIQVAGTSRHAWWEIEPRYGATMAVTDECITRDKDNGTASVTYRTGNGTKARYRFFHFTSDAEADGFISGMERRFEQAGVEVVYGAAGV